MYTETKLLKSWHFLPIVLTKFAITLKHEVLVVLDSYYCSGLQFDIIVKLTSVTRAHPLKVSQLLSHCSFVIMSQYLSNSWSYKKMSLVQPNTLEIFQAFQEMLFFPATVQPEEFLETLKDSVPQPSKQCWGVLHPAGVLLVTGTLWALRQLTLPDRAQGLHGLLWREMAHGHTRSKLNVFKLWPVLHQSG